MRKYKTQCGILIENSEGNVLPQQVFSLEEIKNVVCGANYRKMVTAYFEMYH